MQYIKHEVMDATVTKSFNKRFDQVIKFNIMIFVSRTQTYEIHKEHLIPVILSSCTWPCNLYEILTNIFCVNVNGSSSMAVSLLYFYFMTQNWIKKSFFEVHFCQNFWTFVKLGWSSVRKNSVNYNASTPKIS